MSDRVTDTNYVKDALVERLPSGFSLNRAEQDGQTFYRWTDWTTQRQCTVQVDEQYAHAMGTVDQLCDSLTSAVLDSFDDAEMKNLSTISQRRLANGHA